MALRFFFFLWVFFDCFFALAGHRGQHFDRVIFVVFENTNYANAMAQPFFHQLAQTGASFSNFLALAHPSQGNYFVLTSGDFNGVRDDNVYDVDAENVVDLLERRSLTWKVYVENYPGRCFTGKTKGSYVRKHNPFISFVNIQNNPDRCDRIVNATEFEVDRTQGQLPDYVFYIPDLQHDGHDTGVAYADKWYAKKFQALFADPLFMSGTIVITTFDESGKAPENKIFTSINGPMVKPGLYSQSLNTASLLRLIEENWSLGDLGKLDATSQVPAGIWK